MTDNHTVVTTKPVEVEKFNFFEFHPTTSNSHDDQIASSLGAGPAFRLRSVLHISATTLRGRAIDGGLFPRHSLRRGKSWSQPLPPVTRTDQSRSCTLSPHYSRSLLRNGMTEARLAK